MSDCLNLSFETQGRSQRLESVPSNETGDMEWVVCPGTPQGSAWFLGPLEAGHSPVPGVTQGSLTSDGREEQRLMGPGPCVALKGHLVVSPAEPQVTLDRQVGQLFPY